MGTTATVQLSGFDLLQRRFDALTNFHQSGVIQAVMAEGVSQTQTRIRVEKKSPDGTPWKPWSDSYATTRHGHQSLLESEGHLLTSIVGIDDALAWIVGWGSPRVYASAHQAPEAVGMPVGYPKRDFLGLSDDNESDILFVVNHYLDRALSA